MDREVENRIVTKAAWLSVSILLAKPEAFNFPASFRLPSKFAPLSSEKSLGLKSWLSGPGHRPRETPSTDSRRIAVLPFASMSPDPEDEYFADGMTEEVISTLSRVPEIEVISRTSVMQYKKNPRPLKEVSRELGVGTVLEGSVRKAGNHVRITVQMIDAGRDRNLWSEGYDRELRDVFAIQREVASRVADALKIKPMREEGIRTKKPTHSDEAYTLYLKGRFHWNTRKRDDMKTAVDYFQRSVREDPSFAPAYVGLADTYQLQAMNMQIDPEANHEKAKAAIAKALALDPDMAEAHASTGLILTGELRLREAGEELRRAVTLNPNNAWAHLWYFQILRAQRELDMAQEQIEKGMELDPLSPIMNQNYGVFYGAKKDYPAGVALIKRAIDLDPDNPMSHMYLGSILGLMGSLDEARREFDIAAKRLKNEFPHVALMTGAYMAFFQDDRHRLRRMIPELESTLKEAIVSGPTIGDMYFFLGEQEKGFEWLERAYARRDWTLRNIQTDPYLIDSVRGDRRYEALLKKMQLG